GFLLLIQGIVAKKFEKIAIQKGYDEEIHSFAMCFWLGLAGYLYVIALPDLTISRPLEKKEFEEQKNQPIKDKSYTQSYECPKCKEILPFGIESCPICHQVFDWKQ
ncbi:MAG: hypothetical protein IJX13_08560, partial [Clostridia bacterium]|nr:hypothetical protein [Clostridia bacterium]